MVKNKVISVCMIFISLLIFILFSFYRNRPQDIRIKAQEDPDFCKNTCIGQDRCGLNGPPGDPNYNDPCCEEIAKTGDPGACPWPQRGYCTDAQCGAIPEGVSRQRCGGPRNSWCNMCRDAKCLGYVDESTKPPVPTPTTPPIPTDKSTPTPISIVPTKKPVQPKQSKPSPRIIDVFESPTPTPLPYKINFRLPSIKINLASLNSKVKKPLGLFTYVFKTITSFDKRLEEWINSKVSGVIQNNLTK